MYIYYDGLRFVYSEKMTVQMIFDLHDKEER